MRDRRPEPNEPTRKVVIALPRRRGRTPAHELDPRPSLTAEQITSFVEAHAWRFSKTMPLAPHSYVVKEKCRDETEFERFVLTIRRAGYKSLYGKTNYICLDHPTEVGTTFKFWTMGASLGVTIIINRHGA